MIASWVSRLRPRGVRKLTVLAEIKPSITTPRHGYIYLIREREFVRMKEDVYKIGRSKHFEKRFASYPKDSEILACAFLPDQFRGERKVIETFDKQFQQREDIGREYYEGDRNKILKEFLHLSLELHKDQTIFSE